MPPKGARIVAKLTMYDNGDGTMTTVGWERIDGTRHEIHTIGTLDAYTAAGQDMLDDGRVVSVPTSVEGAE